MRLPLAINAVLAVVALGLAFAAPGEGALRLGAASGSVQLSNSSEGRAVFTAVDMRPGGETRGTVQIGNTGSSAAALTVSRVAENETPGAGGGLLSERLTLQLLDVSMPSSPVSLYYGPLSAMPATAAGRLAPGGTRTFLFIATLPADGADNAYQGAVLTSGFTWDATGSEAPVTTPTATPEPTTTPLPEPTATPQPAPTATPEPTTAEPDTGAVAADEVLNLPDARRCVSRRKFKIHLRKPRGFVLRTLVVKVNKKTKIRLRGAKARRAKATLNLRGLPAGKVKVKIVATSTKGAKIVSKRTYRTCAKKKLVKKKTKRTKKKRQRRSTPPSRS
jgi:hypothetical protein